MTTYQVGITNDFYKLGDGAKVPLLTGVMKKFIEEKRKIPECLLKDLKEAKQNKKGEVILELNTENKNSYDVVKVYYKQYKHLDKYCPKDLDIPQKFFSLQRGARAVDIGKKFEKLIRTKCSNHVWGYDDSTDKIHWLNEKGLKRVKKKCNVKNSTKIDINIGGIDWYGINMFNEEDINYGLSALTDKLILGLNIIVFDNMKSRDDILEWLLK